MLNKKLSIAFIIILFILNVIFFVPHDKIYRVVEVENPTKFVLNKKTFELKGLDTFDVTFTEHNKDLAKMLNISEEEAFVIGNLGKYWASSLMKGRNVYIKNNSDLIFVKYSYREKFKHSAFCIVDGKIANPKGFEYRLEQIRKDRFRVLDLETHNVYKIDDLKVRELKDFLVLRKTQLPKKNKYTKQGEKLDTKYLQGDIKVLLSDFTQNLKPTRSCSTDICKEILANINSSNKTIDMAIYGYSYVPEIELALKKAIQRGVKVRLVYDSDAQGNNIYPNTKDFVNLIPASKSDVNSAEARNIMHNKFYIFDDKVLITGSANLSHTDMSGFNTNSVVIINSEEVAKAYKTEFEQMYSGKFHNDKITNGSKKFNLSGTDIEIYFSPQDKAIANAVLPLIKRAKSYIYIPTFVLTEKRVTQALIEAHNRGVDVRVIMDAVNASIKHTKHWELRNAKILVKTENYAGKMHSKSMIIDDEYTVIGSMNFSNSGENRNDENLVVIKDKNITQFYKKFFLYQWDLIDEKWLKTNVRAEGLDSIGSCTDGIDNNYDGLIDSKDPACSVR